MSYKSHIFGYLLGLLIFVIGIPALMWLVSGRPWPYVPDSAVTVYSKFCSCRLRTDTQHIQHCIYAHCR